MRDLKQDWRDVLGGFKVAFDVWKLVLGFVGLTLTVLSFWAVDAMSAPLTASLLAGLIFVGVAVKFATSQTGLTGKKGLALLAILVLLAGLVVLMSLMSGLDALIIPGAKIVLLLIIWALFGGAITRIAVVEVCTDDRVGVGEALKYARKRYTAYFGATVLPFVAALSILLGCFAYGLLFRLSVVDILLACVFFLVLIAGFMVTLVGLGGLAGAPLMYPAVSAEGNDAFDAISRSYSYVFGRPWRYIFYNFAGLIYGMVCVFFVGMFVLTMLWMCTSAVDVGSGGKWDKEIAPRVLRDIEPILSSATMVGDKLATVVKIVDPSEIFGEAAQRVMAQLRMAQMRVASDPNIPADSGSTAGASALIIVICLYGLMGLVLSFFVSLFFSLQSCVYLLLRKAVDGADMTEVFMDDDMEMDEEDVVPAAPTEEVEEVPKGDAKGKARKSAKGKKTSEEKGS